MGFKLRHAALHLSYVNWEETTQHADNDPKMMQSDLAEEYLSTFTFQHEFFDSPDHLSPLQTSCARKLCRQIPNPADVIARDRLEFRS